MKATLSPPTENASILGAEKGDATLYKAAHGSVFHKTVTVDDQRRMKFAVQGQQISRWDRFSPGDYSQFSESNWRHKLYVKTGEKNKLVHDDQSTPRHAL